MHPDFLYDSSQVVGAGDSARPWEVANSPQLFAFWSIFCRRTGSSAPTNTKILSGYAWGSIEHIDPLGRYEFAGTSPKTGLYRRGDVGIAPYASYRYIGQILYGQNEIAVTVPARTRGRYTRRGSRAAGRPSEAPAHRGSSRSSLPSPRPARQRLAAGQRACGSG